MVFATALERYEYTTPVAPPSDVTFKRRQRVWVINHGCPNSRGTVIKQMPEREKGYTREWYNWYLIKWDDGAKLYVHVTGLAATNGAPRG